MALIDNDDYKRLSDAVTALGESGITLSLPTLTKIIITHDDEQENNDKKILRKIGGQSFVAWSILLKHLKIAKDNDDKTNT